MDHVDNSEFVKSLEQAVLKIIHEEHKKMEKACLILESEAKKNCPVDQGMLRASMTHSSSITSSAIEGIVGSNLEYAPYVHNGTGIYAKDGNGRKTPWTYVVKSGKYKGGHYTQGQKPQPFLEDARDRNKIAILEVLGG